MELDLIKFQKLVIGITKQEKLLTDITQ